jgi:hypothetical protein
MIILGIGVVLVIGIFCTWKSWLSTEGGPMKDVFKYVATICTSFVGLTAAFALNSAKTDGDKKDHLKRIVNAELTNLDRYGTYLELLFKQYSDGHDSNALFVYQKNISAYPFPALLDVRDPVIFDIDPDMYLEFGAYESTIKSALSFGDTKDPKLFYTRCLQPVMYTSVRYAQQVHWQYQLLCDSITPAQLKDSSSLLSQQMKDTINAHLIKNPK